MGAIVELDIEALPIAFWCEGVGARGEGHLAERILALAREHGIPMHQDRELVDVRTRLDLEEDIPGEVYQVVAEILAFLSRAHLTARPASPRAL